MLMDPGVVGLGGLFVLSFTSATVLPGTSELVFMALALGGEYSASALVVVATVGNALGGITSWGLGRVLSPSDAGRPGLARARVVIERFGAPALLASWLPVAGDSLCVVAGWARIGCARALVYIAIGKALRYAALAALAGS